MATQKPLDQLKLVTTFVPTDSYHHPDNSAPIHTNDWSDTLPEARRSAARKVVQDFSPSGLLYGHTKDHQTS